jgi:hypothetical protein
MEWISMNDDLPPLNEIVLCCDAYEGKVTLGKLTEEEGEEQFTMNQMESFGIDSISTHWMSIPTLPEPDQED